MRNARGGAPGRSLLAWAAAGSIAGAAVVLLRPARTAGEPLPTAAAPPLPPPGLEVATSLVPPFPSPRPAPSRPTLLSAPWSGRSDAPAAGRGDAGRTYLYASLTAPEGPAPLLALPAVPHPLWVRAAVLAGRAALVSAVLVGGVMAPTGPFVPRVEVPLMAAAASTTVLDEWIPTEEALVAPAAGSEPPEPTALPATLSAQALAVPGLAGPDLPPVPPVALAAYRAAALQLAGERPACGLPWTVLAAIGAVESRHAASGGSLRADWDGIAAPPILGPRLDGSLAGTARIADTDGGRLDGDATVDRAVGPMQFLPGTWTAYGDGDPQDVRAASRAAGRYLCGTAGDLRDPQQLWAAVFRYNRSPTYVRRVMALSSAYLAASIGSGPEAVAAAAIAFAYARLGDPYLWGGNGPYYDCSGLTQSAFRSGGVALPRTAAQQYLALPPVPPEDMRPGDLLFFQLGARQPGLPGHVAIYLGSGRTVEAPYTGSVVRISSVDRSGPLAGVRRPAVLGTAGGWDGALLAELTDAPGAAPPASPPPAAPVDAPALPGPAPDPTPVPPVVDAPPTAEPTASPTASPTPSPTATDEPDVPEQAAPPEPTSPAPEPPDTSPSAEGAATRSIPGPTPSLTP